MKAKYENHYLTDADVANFARQSFGRQAKEFTAVQNNKLIQFLARGMQSGAWEELLENMGNCQTKEEAHEMAAHLRSIPEHWVPFGHPHITITMQAPVPIARQCFKHKMGYVESEESRRYIKSTPQIYIPDVFRAAAEDVKQGSGEAHPESGYFRMQYGMRAGQCLDLYLQMIEAKVCPEQARFILPQGTEVNWVWTGSLYAYANFFNLRSDSHSQKEVQILAEQVGEIIAPLFPVSWAALTQGKY